jgi:hypothetical protein
MELVSLLLLSLFLLRMLLLLLLPPAVAPVVATTRSGRAVHPPSRLIAEADHTVFKAMPRGQFLLVRRSRLQRGP